MLQFADVLSLLKAAYEFVTGVSNQNIVAT